MEGIGPATKSWAAKKSKPPAAASSPFPLSQAIRPLPFSGKYAKASARSLSLKGRAPLARNPDRPRMILPAVRERLEAVLRHAAMEGALAALRSGTSQISITGLHDVAKALVAAYLTRELRLPSFFLTY